MPVTTTYTPPQRVTLGFAHKLQPGETHHELKQRSYKHVESAHELAQVAGLGCKEKDLLQSSFTDDFPFYTEHEARAIQPSNNGFIFACVNAYFDHKHLVIRPDDVWLAILMQLNMYIQANAEKLRSKFVAHKGKRELVIPIHGQSKSENNPLQFAEFAQRMTHKMQDSIVDPELREWVMPSFTTTTELDRVVASITFMGALSEYFDYGGVTGCGIPSVRLE